MNMYSVCMNHLAIWNLLLNSPFFYDQHVQLKLSEQEMFRFHPLAPPVVSGWGLDLKKETGNE